MRNSPANSCLWSERIAIPTTSSSSRAGMTATTRTGSVVEGASVCSNGDIRQNIPRNRIKYSQIASDTPGIRMDIAPIRTMVTTYGSNAGLLVVPPTIRTTGAPVLTPAGIEMFTWYRPAKFGASPENPTGAVTPPTVAVTWADTDASGAMGAGRPVAGALVTAPSPVAQTVASCPLRVTTKI